MILDHLFVTKRSFFDITLFFHIHIWKANYHQHKKLTNFIVLFKICMKFDISWVCVVENISSYLYMFSMHVTWHLCVKNSNSWNNDFHTILIIKLWDGKLVMKSIGKIFSTINSIFSMSHTLLPQENFPSHIQFRIIIFQIQKNDPQSLLILS
jgi:hypothetical protein